MQYSLQQSRAAWEANAEFWDSYMGEDSNEFHRKAVRPKVTQLLEISPEDLILDIACGNGNYSAYLAQQGAQVVAFDYSPKMIALAKQRQHRFAQKISFHVADATDAQSLRALRQNRLFSKAVSNMAVMDIADITGLFKSVGELLQEDGIFVFATQHPCFVTLTEQYQTAHSYYDEAISGQPQPHCCYHRSLQEIFHLCFESAFVIDGFFEESFSQKEFPDLIIVRARKCSKK